MLAQGRGEESRHRLTAHRTRSQQATQHTGHIMLLRDALSRALIHRTPDPAPPVEAHTHPQGQSGPRRGIRRGIRREIGQAAIQGLVVKL